MYCAMKSKAYSEYELIMERLKTLANVQSFEAKIFSTDMEASLIKIGKVYFGGSTIHRTCSKGFNSNEFTLLLLNQLSHLSQLSRVS